MSRKPLLAANWKMNPPPDGWKKDPAYRSTEKTDVWVFPTYLDLETCVKRDLIVGAQAGHPRETGAATGSISMKMIKDLGCTAVICGHSERRRDCGEKNPFILEQVKAALKTGLTPILCVGETLEQRERGEQEAIVREQLLDVPFENIVIAYEPVWAIGTGKNATPKEADDMHAFIRSLLPENLKETTRILYGGSVTDENAESLIARENIDGFLVGSSSLKPDVFRKILDAMEGSGE